MYLQFLHQHIAEEVVSEQNLQTQDFYERKVTEYDCVSVLMIRCKNFGLTLWWL